LKVISLEARQDCPVAAVSSGLPSGSKEREHNGRPDAQANGGLAGSVRGLMQRGLLLLRNVVSLPVPPAL
jgi:hypothetical protein